MSKFHPIREKTCIDCKFIFFGSNAAIRCVACKTEDLRKKDRTEEEYAVYLSEIKQYQKEKVQ